MPIILILFFPRNSNFKIHQNKNGKEKMGNLAIDLKIQDKP